MFYIPCNLGFEEEVVTEIKESWPWLISPNGGANTFPYPEIEIDRGGVSVDVPLEFGVQFNFFLKTAHRVLWRLADFKTRDFPKLFEKVKQIPWEKYLSSDQVEWVVAASKSRLNNEKRIEETCAEAFAKSVGAKQLGKSLTQFPQKIFVRVFDDHCTISLDSSGEHLHKRGWGTRKGEAPLRETLAAFMLRKMMNEASPAELAQITLVDPMCGSGTLLLEGISLWRPNFARDFSFFNWKHSPKIFKTELWRKNYKLLGSDHPFGAYVGYDFDEKILMAARENFADLQNLTVEGSTRDVQLSFEIQNLFANGNLSPAATAVGKIWCVANPPYGERLRVQGQSHGQLHGKGQAEFFYDDLLAKIASKFNADKLGILLPDKLIVKNLKSLAGYEKTMEFSFSNGGLDVIFLIYIKSKPTEARQHPPKH